MSSFFLSHSSEDPRLAERVRDRLRAWGYDSLFLDFDPDDGIATGHEWERELYRQLRVADAVVYLGTAAAAKSKWCFAELTLARSARKPIYPLDLDGHGRVPLLDDRQWLDLSGGDDRYEQLHRTLRASFDPRDVFGWSLDRPPYPGLATFRSEDAAVFFGRDDLIAEVVAKLDAVLGQHRCVAAIGASGSGKSSLVRAGVVPRIARNERWIVVPAFTPGERPLAALARALAAAFAGQDISRDRETLHRSLERDERELGELIRDLAAGDDGDQRSVLLVLDQAEELIVLAGERERTEFLGRLRAALASGAPLRILLTLRSEFLSASLGDESLAALIDESVLVSPLASSRLAEVVAGPAAKAGIEFAPGLVERIVADTHGGDALPLLAYTLRDLYERRAPDGVITSATYEEIGGVLGALRGRADVVAEHLTGDGQGERILPTLLRLVTVDADGKPARRRVPLDEFSDAEREVLRAFVEARLLTSGRRGDEAVVEVAHEALLRQWPPLREAIDASREALAFQAELERQASEWIRNDRADSYLLRDDRLARARHVLASAGADGRDRLGDAEREFLDASEALRRRERRAENRRRRRTIAGLSLALLVISAVALISYGQFRQASEQRNAAREQRNLAVSRQLAATALSRIGGDQELAALLALEANRAAPTEQAQDALRQALTRSSVFARLDASGPLRRVAFTPSGESVVGTLAGRVEGYDARTGAPRFVLDRDARTFVAAPDGRAAVTLGKAGASLWRMPAGRLQGSLPGGALAAGFLSGRPVVVQNAGGRLQLRAVPSGATLQTLGRALRLGVEGATISPDGRRLFVWGFDSARMWDLGRRRWTGPEIKLADNIDASRGAGAPAFSPDGRLIAIPLFVPRLDVLSADRLRPVARLRPATTLESFAFDRGGDIALGGVARVDVWSRQAGRIVARLPLQNVVVDVALADGGRRVLTVEGSGPDRVWDVARRRVIQTLPQRAGVASVFAMSPDGRSVVAAGKRGGVLMRAGPDSPQMVLRPSAGHAKGIASDPAGRHLVVVGDRIQNVYSVADGRRVAQLRTARRQIFSAFSDDGRLVYGIDRRGGATVWRWRSAQVLARVSTGIRDAVWMDLSPDDRRLVAADDHGRIIVTPARGGRPVEIPGYRQYTLIAEFTRDGRTLVTAAAGEPIRIWNATGTGRPLHTLGKDYGGVLSGDGRRFFGLTYDTGLAAWDIRRGRADSVHLPPVPETGPAGVQMLTDWTGRRLAVSSGSRSWTWDLTDRARERVEIPAGGALALSSDGRYLATAGAAGITVWDAATGALVERLRARLDAQPSLLIGPQGRWVAATDRGSVRLFTCRLCVRDKALLQLGTSLMTRALTAQERRKFVGGPAGPAPADGA